MNMKRSIDVYKYVS